MHKRVFWRADELAKLLPEFKARRLAGDRILDALDASQRAALPNDRWRHINSSAVGVLREFEAHMPPAVKPEPIAEPAPPPAPDPLIAEPVIKGSAPPPSFREALTQLLVDAGRILLADEQFQDIAIGIGRRLIAEALQPQAATLPATAPAEPQAPPAKRKPKVVVIGLLNGQQAMIEREYGSEIALNFVPKDHKGAQLRDATRSCDAAYVMKFSGHAEWNKVNDVAGENVEVGFLTGLDKLRHALEKHRAVST